MLTGQGVVGRASRRFYDAAMPLPEIVRALPMLALTLACMSVRGIAAAQVPPAQPAQPTPAVVDVAKPDVPAVPTRSVPPATVTLPVKFTIVPKVSAVAAATAVVMALLTVTVVPLTPVTIVAPGIFVPVTTMPGTMPVALLTTKLLVFAAPPLVTVMPVGAVLE